MAVQLTTMLAQTFQVATANIIPRLTVGGVNYDTATLTQQWYRTYLASATGTGTRTDPIQFLATTQTLWNAVVAGWTLRLRSDGIVEVTNSAGTWAVNWTVVQANGAIWRNLLGWTGNISSTAANTYAQAQSPPTHVVYAMSRTGTPLQSSYASASGELRDGTDYNFRSTAGHLHATYDFGFAPSDATSQAAQYAAAPYPTPSIAASGRRFAITDTMSTSFSQPWTWQDFVTTAPGKPIGAALGTFQTHIAGSTTSYDVCTLSARNAGQLEAEFMQPHNDQNVKIRGIKLRFSAVATRS